MCGINGLLYHDHTRAVDEALLDRMRAVQQHRGPDERGIWANGHVGFGFNRLSIIDLAGGHQPMTSEDGSVCIVFNGEIYNFMDLRADLASRGWRFRTKSDTEVILHAWEQWGEQCVEKLRGMFAFVIWDRRRQVLFGARDRLGIKPFYYWNDPEVFAFASEMKALLECGFIPREIDPVALEEYLHHRYVIHPRTLLKGICKLSPGHCFTVANGQLQVRPYWQLPGGEPQTISAVRAMEEFRALMEETVRLHLIADVPLGAFLSGGLDSSFIVGLMMRSGVQPVRTFSVGYDAAESELPFARQVARHFGTDHHELFLTPHTFRDLLPKIVRHMGEPVADEACIPLFYLAEFARRKVTVVLSGEGADELFGGYAYNYWRNMAAERWRALPGIATAAKAALAIPSSRVQTRARALAEPLERRYRGVSRAFNESEVRQLLGARINGRSSRVEETYKQCARRDPLSRMLFVDTATWLPDDLLTKADRMTMAASLELRVPFLDHKVVEFAWSLPSSLKIRGGEGKWLLKKTATPLLPHEIIHREKKGFPVPLNSWLRDELAGFSHETLFSSGGASDLLDKREIGRFLEDHQTRDCTQQLYVLLVLDQWWRQFKGA